jgi:ribose transport system substrate-binding protein
MFVVPSFNPRSQLAALTIEDTYKMVPDNLKASDIPLIDTTQFQKSPPWKIGVSLVTERQGFQLMFAAHVRYELSKYARYTKEVFYTNAENDPSKQMKDVRDLLARDIDVLIINPVTTAVAGAVDLAVAKGVPVVVVDRGVPNPKYVTYITVDMEERGRLLAAWLAKELNGEGKIIMLSGQAGAGPVEIQAQGAKKVFSKYPKIEILTQGYTGWSPTEGKKMMASYLQAFPKIDGVWTDSSLQGSGAVEAFVDARRPIPPITGEDINVFFKQWKKYGFKAVVVSYPTYMGSLGVEEAIDVLRGIPVPHVIYAPLLTITEKDRDKYIRPEYPDEMYLDIKLPDESIPFKKTK